MEFENTKVFISGLSHDMPREALLDFFSTFGPVINMETTITAIDQRTRCAIIHFEKEKTSKFILENTPYYLRGCVLKAHKCIKIPTNTRDYPSVFIRPIKPEISQVHLLKGLSRYGRIMGIRILRGKGYGFVSFEKIQSVEKCVAEGYVRIRGHLIQMSRGTT